MIRLLVLDLVGRISFGCGCIPFDYLATGAEECFRVASGPAGELDTAVSHVVRC